MTVIDIIRLLREIRYPPHALYNGDMRSEWIMECITNAPTITLPCCNDCICHECCSIEDTYIEAGIEENKRFCSIGKKRMEDNNI